MKTMILTAAAAVLLAPAAHAGGLSSALGAARAILKGGPAPAGVAAPGFESRLAAASPAKKTAPDFELKDLDGVSVSLSQYRGRHVLLEFWSPGCRPCRNTVPRLAEAYEKYRDKGLVVLSVTDYPPEGVREVLAAAEKEGRRPAYPVLYDRGGRAADAYRVRFIPYFVYVAPDGSVVMEGAGASMLDRVIEKFKETAGVGD